jgi:hypothetical protein
MSIVDGRRCRPVPRSSRSLLLFDWARNTSARAKRDALLFGTTTSDTTTTPKTHTHTHTHTPGRPHTRQTQANIHTEQSRARKKRKKGKSHPTLTWTTLNGHRTRLPLTRRLRGCCCPGRRPSSLRGRCCPAVVVVVRSGGSGSLSPEEVGSGR